ncbi:MAG: leucine-rich repeat domain-containing protein [Gaiellales bacterium]
MALAVLTAAPSALAAPTTVTCSGGGSFGVDDVTHIVSSGSSCAGTANVPEGVIEIGTDAFRAAQITSLRLPSTLATIVSGAFYTNNTVLTSITVAAGNPHFVVADDVLYSRDRHTLVLYPNGAPRTSFAVPASVDTIGDFALAYAAALSDITLPAGLTTLGFAAFAGSGITSISIPVGVRSIEPHTFNGAGNLARIYFAGDAPPVGSAAFTGMPAGATAYRFSSATGFDPAPWNGLDLAYWMPAPNAPAAVAGDASVRVAMEATPLGPAATEFTVTTVEEPGKTCTIAGPSGSCTIIGLVNGRSYTFTATDTDGHAVSAASSASGAVTPAAAPVPSAGTRSPSKPAVLRHAPIRITGSVVVTRGPVPAGVTAVAQTAVRIGPASRTAVTSGTWHAMRVSASCRITATAHGRRYTCAIRLGPGRWAITTRALGGGEVRARVVTRVHMPTRPVAPVTG